MESLLVKVKHKPVYHRQKAYGVGSIIDAGNKADRGALLAGGCVPAGEGAEPKFVDPRGPAKKKSAPKAA